MISEKDWKQIQTWLESSENWSRIESWWTLYMLGEPGSAQQKANELKEALDCTVLTQIRKTLQENDAEFFRTIADGLEQLREKEETALYYLFCTYTFMTFREQSIEDPPLPTKKEIIAQTKRTWAIHLLTGEVTPAPFTTFDPAFEAKIARKIEGLHQQDWTQHLKDLGIVLQNATPGPKRGLKRRNRITRR